MTRHDVSYILLKVTDENDWTGVMGSIGFCRLELHGKFPHTQGLKAAENDDVFLNIRWSN